MIHKLYRYMLTVVIVGMIATPVIAGSKLFTNQDLGKYDESSGPDQAEGPEMAHAKMDTAQNYSEDLKEEAEVKRHIISYAGSGRRIIVPVTFNNMVTVPMLLDTGASGMHISFRLAEKLGIFDNDRAKLMHAVMGVGGPAPAIFTILDSISVAGIEYDFAPTTVSYRNFGDFEGLLGMDFMSNYSVHIDTKRHNVIFEELPPSPDMPGGHDEMWWRTSFHNFRLMKSAWEKFKDDYFSTSNYTETQKKTGEMISEQYEEAERLFNLLNVYASEHSVPLEWR